MARHWLKTRPGIVSRTADGAYGEHLKTRTPAAWLPKTAYGEHLKTRIPAAWLPTTPGQRVTVPQGGVGSTSAPGIQDVYAHPELYGIPLAPGYKPTTPTTPAKRHIPGFFGDGSLRDWQGQDWLARMQQLLGNLPAPLKDWLTNAPAQLNQALSQLPALLKDWLSNYPRLPQSTIPSTTPGVFSLSNYPRLPQSTIPTPTVEYPASGRPPKYTNPFAWRRKNSGWW